MGSEDVNAEEMGRRRMPLHADEHRPRIRDRTRHVLERREGAAEALVRQCNAIAAGRGGGGHVNAGGSGWLEHSPEMRRCLRERLLQRSSCFRADASGRCQCIGGVRGGGGLSRFSRCHWMEVVRRQGVEGCACLTRRSLLAALKRQRLRREGKKAWAELTAAAAAACGFLFFTQYTFCMNRNFKRLGILDLSMPNRRRL